MNATENNFPSEAETLVVLEDARRRLAPPEAWTCGESSLPGYSFDSRPTCLEGALQHAAYERFGRRAKGLLAARCAGQVVARGLGLMALGCLVAWNDEPARTHAEVLAALDKALKAQRQMVLEGA